MGLETEIFALTGRHVLITGADQGIDLALIRRLATADTDIVLKSCNGKKLQSGLACLQKARCQAQSLVFDVTNFNAVRITVDGGISVSL